jgi:hypothetical protein
MCIAGTTAGKEGHRHTPVTMGACSRPVQERATQAGETTTLGGGQCFSMDTAPGVGKGCSQGLHPGMVLKPASTHSFQSPLHFITQMTGCFAYLL